MEAVTWGLSLLICKKTFQVIVLDRHMDGQRVIEIPPLLNFVETLGGGGQRYAMNSMT